ncbi:MAG TPA: holo-ACP synthase [Urbifossiella sp.]
MNIVGIGTQIVDCTRVRKLIDRHGETFLAQVYTEDEMRFCNSRTHVTEHFTAIWAAKEAVLRSLGTKWHRGMNWTDIEIHHKRAESPTVEVGGETSELMVGRGVRRFLLTMAHCRTFATATSLAVR